MHLVGQRVERQGGIWLDVLERRGDTSRQCERCRTLRPYPDGDARRRTLPLPEREIQGWLHFCPERSIDRVLDDTDDFVRASLAGRTLVRDALADRAPSLEKAIGERPVHNRDFRRPGTIARAEVTPRRQVDAVGLEPV